MVDGMIFWTGSGDDNVGWLRVADGRVVQRGVGSGWQAATGLVALPAGERALLIVPAGDTALHWIACPGMTVRQGAAAAPLMALEGSIGPMDALHAGVIPAATPDQPHIVAVASRAVMERGIALCSALGVPDAVMVPAPLLLPPPEEGFTAGRIGDGPVLRGTDCAFDATDGHARLVVGDAPVRAIDDDAVETGLAAALSHPPLDLRQGGYAVRRATGIDAIWLTRIAAMAGLVLLVSVLISIVTIARLHYESASLDAKTVALAKDVVPDARDAVDANARLAAVVAQRGGGATFTGIAAGIMGAMQGAPGVTMTSLSQLADGTVRVQLSGSRAEDINMVLIALQNAGWRIAANAVQQQGAQVVADISVVPS